MQVLCHDFGAKWLFLLKATRASEAPNLFPGFPRLQQSRDQTFSHRFRPLPASTTLSAEGLFLTPPSPLSGSHSVCVCSLSTSNSLHLHLTINSPATNNPTNVEQFHICTFASELLFIVSKMSLLQFFATFFYDTSSVLKSSLVNSKKKNHQRTLCFASQRNGDTAAQNKTVPCFLHTSQQHTFQLHNTHMHT